VNNIWAVATVVIKELYRRKDFYVLFILTAVLTLLAGSVNFFNDDRIVRYVKEICLLLIWIASLVVAITMAARHIPMERESRTIFPLLAKPITRTEVLLGKFLGCWLACWLALALFYLFFGVICLTREKEWLILNYVQAMLLHGFMLGIVTALALLGSLIFAAPSSTTTILLIVCTSILLVGRHLNKVAVQQPEPQQTLLTAVYYRHSAPRALRRARPHHPQLAAGPVGRLPRRHALRIGLHRLLSRRGLPGLPPKGADVKWPAPALPLLALGAAFTLAAQVEPWYQTWAGTTTRQGNALQVLLGDSRRMFANHFFVKADAYFHSGYYPSVFDNREAFHTAHMAADAGAVEEQNTGDEHAFLGESQDWIDNFGRRFFPSVHTHLDEGGAAGHHPGDGHDHAHEPTSDEVREILPWLRMSVELDPHRVESYVVAAYWLRERMHRVEEAEQFLRDGLRANPHSYEILYELGRLAFDSRGDNAARPHHALTWPPAAGSSRRTPSPRANATCLCCAISCPTGRCWRSRKDTSPRRSVCLEVPVSRCPMASPSSISASSGCARSWPTRPPAPNRANCSPRAACAALLR
jgi:ABC-type transport system involved in multi-copper enzyme maturation permease subunit